jgi:hypothetical protein
MDPNLNCSDPGLKMVLSFDNVGYRLENAGLVHFMNPIPFCLIILITITTNTVGIYEKNFYYFSRYTFLVPLEDGGY